MSHDQTSALGEILAVRVGRASALPYRGGTVTSAIRKSPVEGPVMLRAENLEGDEQADLSVHGGPNKAVYVYAADDYAWWRERLDRDLPDGILGENLTVSGGWVGGVRIGDRFGIGNAVIAATEPREPCFKLGATMQDQSFLKRFRNEGRTGFYARVVTESVVTAGDTLVQLETSDPRNLMIAELHDLYVTGKADRDRLTVAVDSPDITHAWRGWATKRLEALG